MDSWQKQTVLGYAKEYRGILALSLALAAINQIFSFLDPIIFQHLIDDYALRINEISREAFIAGVLLLLAGIIGVALVSRTAKTFQDYYVNVITQRVGTSLYARAVEHTLSLPFAIFEDRRSGEVLQKLQKARLDVQTVITSGINVVFLSLVGILFVVIYAFTIHWLIGLLYFLLIPLLGVLAYTISRKIKAAQSAIVRETSELAASTTETLRNIELVKSLGLEEQEITRLNRTNEEILDLELKKVRILRKLSFIQGTVVNAMRSLLLFIMLYLLFLSTITLGQLMSLFFYSFFIFNILGQLGQVAGDYQQARASMDVLSEIFSLKPRTQPRGAKRIATLHGIEAQRVGFSYQETSALHEVNFSLRSGETIAFAGSSGSGKSTIVKLLVGLYEPRKGKIVINGIPLSRVDRASLRQRIGLVAQETQLFAGTIRENLLFANPGASDEACLDALRMASIDHIIERTGKGLDTRIGEGGLKLSGGERQRLAIARALLREPDLLIFDEATSSLDSSSERSITKTIQRIAKERPSLMIVLIAHRLSTLTHADRIYVLEKGRVVEEGSHKDLLRKQGAYAAFWRQQSGRQL